MKYITLQEFRDYSKISTDQISDPIATIIIDGAEAFMDKYTRTKFKATNKTINVKGQGSNKLYLNYAPIISIDSVLLDGSIIEPIDIKKRGLISFDRSISEEETLEISLNYGYEPIPPDVKLTLLDLITDLAGNKLNREDTKGAKKKKLGRMYEVETREDSEIYDSYILKLSDYRIPRVRRA